MGRADDAGARGHRAQVPPSAASDGDCAPPAHRSAARHAAPAVRYQAAARSAGRSLAKDFREVENLQVTSKSAGDFVSRADIAAEAIIRDQLTDARPNYGWLGEESDPVEGKDPTRRWIVDPLDGTTNFLHGLPHWGVSIALEHKGAVVSAVIFDPAKDELFVAEKGQGAWLNQSRLRVSDRKRMIESVFATGLPFGNRQDMPEAIQDLARLMPVSAGVRRWGAAALDLAYVAAGRFDGFWERKLNAWDIAAGLLLVREAGGLVESIDGTEEPLDAGNVLAAAEPIFDTFARVIRASE